MSQTEWRQDFYVEGKFYGSGTRKRDIYNNTLPRGIAFFCPKCARIWALCPIQGMEYDLCHSSYCEGCAKDTILGPAGSIWSGYDRQFDAAFPRELLLREFELALKYQDYLTERKVTWGPRETAGQSFSEESNSPDIFSGLLA